MEKSPDKDRRVRIGITHGDINGIGYEVIIKALYDNRINEFFTIIVYGNSKIASYHRKILNLGDFNFNLIKNADAANPKRSNIINCFDYDAKVELGKNTKLGGILALESLKAAVKDLKSNKIDVLVTAPINKYNIQSEDFRFPGHTEFLAKEFDAKEVLMLMVSNNLRIGVITGHIPLREIPNKLSKELILNKIRILNNSLIKDFNIRKPRIALLGVNPHAGDNGFLGTEEQSFIVPAVTEAFNNNFLAFGPYSADGFFGSGEYNKFDGILAMYHDQGLLPFKTLAFDTGVNFTAGLPIVRTSPAHGTAFDIVGQNKAQADSFREALYLGNEIYKNRIANQKLSEYAMMTNN
jgi:4-hydroxythreonine-4-phosphate dehydrogenase